jgi:transcriptional regulator with XRE-family HTH domain
MVEPNRIEPIYRKVALRLREELRKQGKTAEKLAYEVDLGKAQVSLFLNGKRRVTLHTLERLAKGLDVRVKDLFP